MHCNAKTAGKVCNEIVKNGSGLCETHVKTHTAIVLPNEVAVGLLNTFPDEIALYTCDKVPRAISEFIDLAESVLTSTRKRKDPTSGHDDTYEVHKVRFGPMPAEFKRPSFGQPSFGQPSFGSSSYVSPSFGRPLSQMYTGFVPEPAKPSRGTSKYPPRGFGPAPKVTKIADPDTTPNGN